MLKIEVYLPDTCIDILREKLAEEGIGVVGPYAEVTSFHPVRGTWRPLPGSSPYAGEENHLSRGEEYKLEFRCAREKAGRAVEIIRAVHPYETPLINLIPLANAEFGLT